MTFQNFFSELMALIRDYPFKKSTSMINLQNIKIMEKKERNYLAYKKEIITPPAEFKSTATCEYFGFSTYMTMSSVCL